MDLDVGCGCAAYGPLVIARGNVNVDIRKPEKKVVNFVLCDAHNLPFQAEAFSSVFFYDVIEHVPNPLQCLTEIYRCLKQKGSMFLSTPNPLHWRKFLRAMRGKDILLTPCGQEAVDYDHITTWTDAEMRHILFRAGFKSVRFDFAILGVTALSNPSRYWIDMLAFRLGFKRVTGVSMLVSASKE